MGKTNRYGDTGRQLGEITRTRKKGDFPAFCSELLISKFITPVTDRKLRDKLMKVKVLDIPKVNEQLQQNTYDQKNIKNTRPEALISNREQDMKEEPLHEITYTGHYKQMIEKSEDPSVN